VTTLRKRREELARLPRRGGRPSLDFVNTVDPRQGPTAHDFLGDYVDFALWAAGSGAVDESAVGRLIRLARRSHGEADAVFARALALREALYRTFLAAVGGAKAPVQDLERLRNELRVALGRLSLRPGQPSYAWSWDESLALDRPLWPLARDAADLLTAPELERVKLCPGRDCGWLFVDASKNRSRRWCSMEVCGSREKMRRLHARRRSALQ
jgi:predicted RNA-binding Zn ribbon-like protein